MTKPDFGGYATKNDLECLDGRIIRQDAFKHQNGAKVPLVWMHNSKDPSHILGYAELENRPDGVYARGYFNDSTNAKNAKGLIQHGAIKALSIYANKLGQVGKDVRAGVIKEVSLVLGGANPGALIDTVAFQHDEYDEVDANNFEAVITSGELIHSEDGEIEVDDEEVAEEVAEEPVVQHEDPAPAEDDSEETVGDILATLTPKQKAAVGVLLEAQDSPDDAEMQQSEEEDLHMVKKNVFDQTGDEVDSGATLTHADFLAIVEEAKTNGGSLKKAFYSHAESRGLDVDELMHAGGLDAGYGMENVGYLFPDARQVGDISFVQRNQDWVTKVVDGCRHTPFSRIKTLHADITADEARAKGYVTGSRKMEEVFKLLKRTTEPTTIYKKQKLDRDDMVDITDLNVVAWLKAEMRVMLNEEIARAVLLGDGRSSTSEDKIDEEKIRPIAFDDSFYTIVSEIPTANDTADECLDAIIRAKADYKGSGRPKLFVSDHVLSDWLLAKDDNKRRLYANKAEIESLLGVEEIVTCPLMTDALAFGSDSTHEIYAIMVNMNDYTIGADAGGALNMFDDFDIDYNQYKYLMETRISGALTLPYSAIVFTTDTSGGAMG